MTRCAGHRGGDSASSRRQFSAEAAAAAVLAVLAPPFTHPALALSEEQQLVVEVWKEVSRQYVDSTYNGLGEEGWKKKRLDAVKALSGLEDADESRRKQEAYSAIRRMLGSLGDPYTRFLTPEQFDALAALASGDSAGIGVQLQVEPSRGDVMVISTVPGGPAAAVGLEGGDVITAVDGVDVTGTTAELVAARLRGPAGTTVRVTLRPAKGKASKDVDFTRAAVKVSPVEARRLDVDGKSIGAIRISSFSKGTPNQVLDALRDVGNGAAALVIDLRGNAGGFMPAGVETAKLFLPPNAKVISEIRRDGTAENFFSEGVGSETRLPLYLLVDSRTASAAEILAGALQDNGRATVIGSSKTFGKGRIQNVQQLEDGSAVAVTKAKYVTPKGRDIHGQGLVPDIIRPECSSAASEAECLAGKLPL